MVFLCARIPVHIRGIHKRSTRLCTPLGYTKDSERYRLLGYTVHHLACTVQPPALADLGGGVRDARPPLGVQILSISCSFRENLACSRPPLEGSRPPLGKILDPPLPRAYINSTSCLALHKMGVEYRESENVTPVSSNKNVFQ